MESPILKTVLAVAAACVLAAMSVGEPSENGGAVRFAEHRDVRVAYTEDFSAETADSVVRLLANDALGGRDAAPEAVKEYALLRDQGETQVLMPIAADFNAANQYAATLPLIARIVADKCFGGEPVVLVTDNGMERTRFVPYDPMGEATFIGKSTLFCAGTLTSADAPGYAERLAATGLFGPDGTTFRVAREADGSASIRLPVQVAALRNESEPARKAAFEHLATTLREALFLGYPTTVCFSDNGLQPIEGWVTSVPASVAVDHQVRGESVVVQYRDDFPHDAAERIAQRIVGSGDPAKPIYLRLVGNGPDVEGWVPIGGATGQAIAGFLGTEVLAELPDSPGVVIHPCDENFVNETETHILVTARGGDWRGLGRNRLYSAVEIDPAIVDGVEADLRAIGMYTDQTSLSFRIDQDADGYVLRWLLLPRMVNDSMVAAAAQVASHLNASSMADLPFRLEISDLSMNRIADHAWSNQVE